MPRSIARELNVALGAELVVIEEEEVHRASPGAACFFHSPVVRSIMLVCPCRPIVRAAVVVLVVAACSKPEPVAPEPPVEAPPPPPDPPSALPLAPEPPILVQAVGLERPASAA